MDASVTVSIIATKNTMSITPVLSKSFNITGDEISHHHQIVGSSEEAIELPADISGTLLLFLAIRHVGTSGVLSVGKTGNFFQALQTGEFTILWRPTAMPYLKANTGTIRVEIIAFADVAT